MKTLHLQIGYKQKDRERTRAETAQTMANSEVYEKSSESHEKFMRKS